MTDLRCNACATCWLRLNESCPWRPAMGRIPPRCGRAGRGWTPSPRRWWSAASIRPSRAGVDLGQPRAIAGRPGRRARGSDSWTAYIRARIDDSLVGQVASRASEASICVGRAFEQASAARRRTGCRRRTQRRRKDEGDVAERMAGDVPDLGLGAADGQRSPSARPWSSPANLSRSASGPQTSRRSPRPPRGCRRYGRGANV